MSEPREILDWADVGPATRELAESVNADGFRPDVILAIARAGLIVAASLGYALGVKNTWTMNVEFYTGVDERLDLPIILPPVPELVDLEEAKILIADDVADTGATLALVKEFCGARVGEVRISTLYEKPHSRVKCEYVWRRTDKWIVFPWSAEPPLTAKAPTSPPADAAGAGLARGETA
ncbi:MAG: phosphoribosyltransferase [Gaiellaceae bacterium]